MNYIINLGILGKHFLISIALLFLILLPSIYNYTVLATILT